MDPVAPIRSPKYDGRMRWLWPSKCSVCPTITWVPKHCLRERRTCSVDCRAKSRQERTTFTCANDRCRKNFERRTSCIRGSKSGLMFCSRTCKDTAQRLEGLQEIQPPHYGTGQQNKSFLIRTRGHRCEKCGLSVWLGEPIPLELDHIDGNAFNNDPANHRLLCPNCHAQTPTYCGRNRGRGRKLRKLTSVTGL